MLKRSNAEDAEQLPQHDKVLMDLIKIVAEVEMLKGQSGSAKLACDHYYHYDLLGEDL